MGTRIIDSIYATVVTLFIVFAAPVLPSLAQSPSPPPSTYTFTFTAADTDAVYAALERASQLQVLVTGERSSRFDTLETQIRQGVIDQKTAAAKAAAADAAKPQNTIKHLDEPTCNGSPCKKEEAKPEGKP